MLFALLSLLVLSQLDSERQGLHNSCDCCVCHLGKCVVRKPVDANAGHNGSYIGSPELGLLNVLQAREQVPNAPLASDPVALDRLWSESIKCIDDAAGEHWAKDGPQAPPATKDTPVMGN